MAEHSRSRVDLEEVMRFVFDPKLQHPLSYGRLVSWALYGPLDTSQGLRGGARGGHTLLKFELDAMAIDIERQDILLIYLPEGTDVATLSAAEHSAILAQADRCQKSKRGRGTAPHSMVSKDDVVRLFADLPRDADGKMLFSQMQQRVVDWRQGKVRAMRLAAVGRKPEVDQTRMKLASIVNAVATGSSGAASTTAGGRRPRRRVSTDVCPTSFFQKGQGLGNNQIAGVTNKLLSTQAYRIATLGENANDPGLCANIRLLKTVAPLREDKAKQLDVWDANCCLRTKMGELGVSGKGSYVAATSTALQRSLYRPDGYGF